MLNDTLGTMTVLRLTIKDQKVGGSQFLENLTPSPKSWNNHPTHLVYEMTVSYKLVLARSAAICPYKILNSMLLQLLFGLRLSKL